MSEVISGSARASGELLDALDERLELLLELGIEWSAIMTRTGLRSRPGVRAAGLGLLVAGVEALDAAGGVDQLLLAGEERMAAGADLDLQLFLGRASGSCCRRRSVTVIS